MTSTILITGAPGNVGTEIVRQFPNRAALRIAAFDPQQAQAVLGDDLDILPFDFAKPETFEAAFAGIERMFLMRPPAISDVPRYIVPAIEAAKAAGVQQIVFLSLQGVENNRITPHYKIEQALEASGIPYTFLRCGFFMQNLSTTHRDEIRLHDEIAVPVGQAKTAFIDVRDIAAVAVRALTEPGHANQKYTLTGSEALDYGQVAGILSQTLGRTIRYTNPFILRFLMRQRQAGKGWSYALVLTMLYTITRFGNAAQVTEDVRRLLGHTPISFAEFAQDHRAAWARG